MLVVCGSLVKPHRLHITTFGQAFVSVRLRLLLVWVTGGRGSVVLPPASLVFHIAFLRYPNLAATRVTTSKPTTF